MRLVYWSEQWREGPRHSSPELRGRNRTLGTALQCTGHNDIFMSPHAVPEKLFDLEHKLVAHCKRSQPPNNESDAPISAGEFLIRLTRQLGQYNFLHNPGYQ